MNAPVKLHLVRHGEVASHRGDIPVTEAGLAVAEEAGRRLAGDLVPDEEVHFLYAPTRRARETAAAIREGVAAGAERARLLPPVREWALRNPDLYVAGRRVEMVSTPEALSGQVPHLGAKELAGHRFFREFWASPDRVGYWVGHPEPPGEDAGAVARRVLTFAASLLDLPAERPERRICVTHSPVLRAFLRRYVTDEDPGEPDYLESVDLILIPGGPLYAAFRGLRRVLPSPASGFGAPTSSMPGDARAPDSSPCGRSETGVE